MTSYWQVYLAVRTFARPVTAAEVARVLATDTTATSVALVLLQGVELVYRTSNVGAAATYAVGGRATSDSEAKGLAAAWGLDLSTPVGQQ